MKNLETKLIFEQDTKYIKPTFLDPLDVPANNLESYFGDLARKEELDFPNVPELEVIRHYTNLSSKNYGVENGMYPLGSCTMKYNPKINEDLAGLEKFTEIHPLQDESTVQGSLELYYNLEQVLNEITGMDAYSFQPSAGAHGEYLGLLLIKAYHESRQDEKRKYVLIPDSGHGTNPASATMVDYEVRVVKSNSDGSVNMDHFRSCLGDDVAALMLTNPSTLGLFEEQVKTMTTLVHEAGGLCYYDGANINAILMQSRPGDMGFDVVHLNVHKSFSTPHGGGGPGAGPVGLKEILKPFRPVPVVEKKADSFAFNYDIPATVGKVRGFAGSFSIFVRTYAFILANGGKGLQACSEAAVANANYLARKLADAYDLASPLQPMHEFVLSGMKQKEMGVSTNDIAKRLMDFHFHPPTVYFPMTVREAMMFEPSETETRASLDRLVKAMLQIAQEVEENPDLVRNAPHLTPIARPDEVLAIKEPKLKV